MIELTKYNILVVPTYQSSEVGNYLRGFGLRVYTASEFISLNEELDGDTVIIYAGYDVIHTQHLEDKVLTLDECVELTEKFSSCDIKYQQIFPYDQGCSLTTDLKHAVKQQLRQLKISEIKTSQRFKDVLKTVENKVTEINTKTKELDDILWENKDLVEFISPVVSRALNKVDLLDEYYLDW